MTRRYRRDRKPAWSPAKRLATAVLAASAIAIGIGAAGWADRQSGVDDRKASVQRELDKANARQRAAAPDAQKPGTEELTGLIAPNDRIEWDQGVTDTQEAPIPKGVIAVNSAWGQTIGANHYSAYAGESVAQPGRGMIVVQTFTLGGAHVSDEDYLAPAGTATLHISYADQHVLYLKTPTGETLTFDFDKRTFNR
jgi:hypothetical protein